MPKGAFEIVIMTTLGTSFALFLRSHLQDPKTFIILALVLLGIPGLTMSLVNLFAKEETASRPWRQSRIGNVVYKVASLVVLGGLVYTIFGGDIVHLLA